MKSFLIHNWYRVIKAASLLLFATGIFVLALKFNTAKAGEPTSKPQEAIESVQLFESRGFLWEVRHNPTTNVYTPKQVAIFR